MFCIKREFVWFIILAILTLIYFLLFTFLPSQECGFNDWKPPTEISGSQPCNCSGIIKYDLGIYGKMECVGRIVE
jgi:hypothetical protein